MKNYFDKIKGYKEEKKELLDICELMERKDELVAVGGRIPKGVFLVGPNGVGKTQLALSFIEKSNYECIKVDTSDIDDDDLSSYKDYIKRQFKMASAFSKSIIFIDEIDKMIGTNPRYHSPNNYDKGRILLEEVNKYNDNSNIFLLFVGNEDMRFGESLVRSGRIDKIIKIDYPNEYERQQIINHYLSKTTLKKEVDIDEIVCMTKGCSGADIESVINNAITNVFLKREKSITQTRIRVAFHDFFFKSKNKELRLNDESYNRVAIHETGHAVASIVLTDCDHSVISIISNGRTQGYMITNSNEKNLETIKSKYNTISVLMAGLIAEELYLNSRGLGSKKDIKQAKEFVQELVREDGYLGFDKTIVDDFKYDSAPVVSEKKLRRIEKAESNLLKKIIKETKDLLISNKELFEVLLGKLKKQKILYKEEIDEIKKTYAK